MEHFTLYFALLTSSYENSVLSLLSKHFFTNKQVSTISEISYMLCLQIALPTDKLLKFNKDNKFDSLELFKFIKNLLSAEKIKMYSFVLIPQNTEFNRICGASNFNHSDFDKKVIDMVKKVSLMQD